MCQPSVPRYKLKAVYRHEILVREVLIVEKMLVVGVGNDRVTPLFVFLLNRLGGGSAVGGGGVAMEICLVLFF